jgi:hypothetical protein
MNSGTVACSPVVGLATRELNMIMCLYGANSVKSLPVRCNCSSQTLATYQYVSSVFAYIPLHLLNNYKMFIN